MDCMPNGCRTDTVLPGAAIQAPQNRLAAALYLQAATSSEDDARRAHLRRCAAELILPRTAGGADRGC